MLSALAYSHDQLKQLIDRFPNGTFIDATLGNGNDIFYILKQPNFTGTVYGFDIQSQAITASQERLLTLPTQKQNQYHLFQESHDQVSTILPTTPIHGAIFNLGYLPGGDHHITTLPNSTITALKQIAVQLVKHGKIILVVYWGHEEGKIESQTLLKEVQSWPQSVFQVLKYEFINQINYPPYVLVIERIKMSIQ